MKKIKSIIMIIVMVVCISNVTFAHGGNITGWKDKNSKNITEYNGKYYGYHKQNGEKHYHQVKWDEESQKWVIIAPAVYYDENFNKIEENSTSKAEKIMVELVSTVDGDTAKFKMNGETVTVRFLGINTKETVHPEIGEEAYGKEASNFTKSKLENATKIELEFDNSADEKDKYNRYLAWIWTDDELLQNLLVESGLAETYMLQNNYKYAGMLQESEELAKNNKLGIWSDDESNTQNSENQAVDNNTQNSEKQVVNNDNPIVYGNNRIENSNNQDSTETNSLELIIIGFTMLLLVSMLSITHKKKKRK